MLFERINPMTGAVASQADAMQAADISALTARAAAAFPVWSVMGPNARRAILMKAATALEARAEAFVEAMMGEIGATKGWALFNLGLAASMVREAAALTTQIAGEVIPSDKPGCVAMALREPVGVILGIAPWNAPIILGVRAIAVPLACGNAVILKASEQCPRTHSLIVEAFAEAGFPEGTVSIVTNAPADAADVVGALIDAKEVRRINFTGSTAVGRIIAKRAAEHLKPCLLELGGKAPLIVLDDADLDEAVKAAAFGAFMNQGQICMSTERIVVDAAIADEFVAKFAARAKALPEGDPTKNAACVIGPMVAKESGPRLNALIDDALAKGATLASGGRANGALMPATIVDHVKPGMKIYDEETFGPITTVVRVQGVDEAVSVANDTAYGLSAGVFGRDVTRALAVALQVDCGSVHVNGATVQNEAQAPYGGMKDSGYGKFDGRAVIDEFTELKWITLEPSVQQYPV